MPPASELRAAAVIVAAGQSTRFGTADKTLVPLLGRPALAYSLDAAAACPEIVQVIVVVSPESRTPVERLIGASGWKKTTRVALGGERRQDSVEAGLRMVADDIVLVAVHDGARPLITAGLFSRCLKATIECGAAIAAAPVNDTIKRVEAGTVVATVPREGLWAAQTPQAFRIDLLRDAFGDAVARGLEVTDEAALFEARGLRVAIVPSDAGNIKITRPEDVAIAEALLAARRTTALP